MNPSQQKREKSRNITIYEFFCILQKEYIVAELRKKIYPALKDKKYYETLMSKKEEKIKDISFRNKFPSIFDSEGIKKTFYSAIYTERGLPNFIYNSDAHKEIFEQLDIENYFAKNSEVKIFKEGKMHIGKIKEVNYKAQLVEVEVEGNPAESFSILDITRVL